jgi:hypothetical protein
MDLTPGVFRRVPPWLALLLAGLLGLAGVAGAVKWRAAHLLHSKGGTANGGGTSESGKR